MKRGHDPGGRLSLFDVLTLAVGLASGGMAFIATKDRFGWVVTVLSTIAAALVGAFVVQFFTQLRFQSFIRELAAMPTPALRSKLESDVVISHLIVPILLRRGESRHELRDYTLTLLASRSALERWHGWRTLNMWFPEAVSSFSGMDPLRPGDQYFERVEALRGEGAVTSAPPNST